MKAVVLEVRDGVSAVMREDGTVEKLNRVLEVGEVIELQETAKILSFPKAAKRKTFRVIAASLVAAFLIFAGTFHYSVSVKACSFVSIDVNPSLEYVLNRKDRVISAGALNEDAKPLVDRLNQEGKLKGKTLAEAIRMVTGYLKELGYLAGDGGERDMLISVSSENEEISERLAKTVQETVEADHDTPIHIEVKKATLEEHKKAQEYGISTGRLVKAMEEKEPAVRDGKAEGSLDLSAEEIEKAKNSSVAELMEPVPETENVPTEEAAPAPADTAEQTKPGKDDKKKEDKKKEDKKKEDQKKKDKEEKEKKTEEEEKGTEAESEKETEKKEESPKSTETPEAPETGTTETTEKAVEPETETETEESTETEISEEEKAAAEAEEVRHQQEILAAEEEAAAEAVRQQQEFEASEGVIVQSNKKGLSH